ncbi:P-loop containing nucleoside triphosphate hydrolase protein [Aureobasidium pullulans]|uniref:RNA helicase n=1 Tax=Aureobasidium pullulans TaxID=5580 RepID=A0A4S9Y591_AURPU|nr:P-loop containing nucleoside triphosphate hydrolase protein [Aureobasidium pullulans]
MSGRPRSPPRRSGDSRRDDRYRRDDRRDRDDRRGDDRYYRRRSPEPVSRCPNVHKNTFLSLTYFQRDRYSQDRDLISSRGGRDRRFEERPLSDRSRDRKRSRERSPVKDRRDRSRDRPRDSRHHRDDSRDRKRPKRTDSVESRARSARDDARGSLANTKSEQPTSAHAADKAAEEERKKLERQAKVEAWKKKQEEKKKLPQSPATPATPAHVATPTDTAASSPKSTAQDEPQKGFAGGKFDPKAIAKKAAAATAKLSALGSDVSIPGKSKTAAVAAPLTANKAADFSKKPFTSQSKGTSFPTQFSAHSTDLKTANAATASDALKKGFGLTASPAEERSTPQPAPAIDMDDEQVERRKLEKLPTPDLNDTGDAALANQNDTHDDDGDVDIADAGSDQDIDSAARLAAERRAAQAAEASVDDDDAMEGIQTAQTANAAEEEDIDPLDAFMNGLAEEAPMPTRRFTKTKIREAEDIFGDQDGADLDAIGEDADDILAQVANKKKKKEIPNLDHSKIDYEPFRKAFYTEPLEIGQMTDEEVRDLRFQLDDIKVQGSKVPRPALKFAQFGLGTQVLDVIRDLGFEMPTPIQAQTIPAIMSGRDVIGVAKTGSGKTVAFLLPMFRHIKDQRPLESMDGPIGLIMAPTRELAVQIHRECKPYLKVLNLRAVCCYGGAPIKDQIAELKKGAEIIVATPGRLVDLLAANSGRVTNLRRVTYVVLDEADRMFDMGFEPQVVKVLTNIRPDHQTVLFSATLPRTMESLARKVVHKPVQITVGGRSTVADTITQKIEVRPESTKMYRTLEALGELFEHDEDARALIFVERQESADDMMIQLQQKGYPAVSIHGGREQIDRDSAIQDFKSGVIPVMVATSVAARGLDVKQLKLVINYDSPNHLEDYVHRSGRTGRAGEKGTAITFVTPEQSKYSVDLVKALKMSNQDVPEELQKMSSEFLKRVKEGKEKAGAIGFGGRGIERFDEQRAAERQRERKAHKLEGEEEEEEEEDKKKAPEEKINVVKNTGSPTPTTANANVPGVPAHIDLNADIKVHKTEVPAPASNRPLDRVAAAAANINSRLGARNATRPGVPIDNKGPDAGAYHATLEINDFPQKARWAVTNRTNVAKILESTGVSITSKGNFYAAGKDPGPTDAPKLYILVEGDTELQVTQAMRDLQRLLKEGTIAAADSEARAPTSGRYTVT